MVVHGTDKFVSLSGLWVSRRRVGVYREGAGCFGGGGRGKYGDSEPKSAQNDGPKTGKGKGNDNDNDNGNGNDNDNDNDRSRFLRCAAE